MKMRYVLASGSSAAREIDMNKMKSVICFLALGAISPHAWATPNNDDIKAMLSQAKSGDASAQTQLGILYAEGSGVTRDYKKARSWFEQAGKQNYADAEYNLGVMYGNGDGVARDSKKALTWFEKAAEHGHIGARYNLGMIYGQGIGTAKDLVRAAFWFELAGQDGSPEDKYTLGVMYSKGEPLEKNDVKARQWFERAANEGHVLAQYNLAVMYSEGLGGDRDLRKARHWADKAAGQGDPEATRLLSVLNERGKQSPFEILMVAGGDPAAAPHIVPPVRLGADHGVEKPAAETLSETPAAVINTAPTTESVEIIEIDEGSTGVEIEK
ncbi:sel1 repeat family protein [Klebsiella pneumoniae subsp. pneumoniae]|nr:sel1 repeat family protein [Klebsiella pneumoniae subsp. pneumoniae]